MMPLFDMLLNSQNGKGFSRIQKQFDLDEEQAQKAVEAVMPAFFHRFETQYIQPNGFWCVHAGSFQWPARKICR